eukprot:CAMPEP_0203806648 /NCGR_PEP_ID=MMETSP0115-20131106/608_1 /ASSEMBLY_ACC=CAM_ASM_000227 /TAXON_ID=33651 /ORGANISM="Bicosoecid sp, Strain ms1" /LENGTH=1073 /DNA_ID=CAMNT_0050715311 /DNA_START=76 /DNA_END=3297 /DNA_ORIENTATION=-
MAAVDNPAADPTDVSVAVDDETMMCEMQKLLDMLMARPEPPVVQQLVDLARSAGMAKFVAWGALGRIDEAAHKKKKPFARTASMMLFEGLCNGLGRAVEPFMTGEAIASLPFFLMGDRHKAVLPAAGKALEALKSVVRVNPTVAVATLPAVVVSLNEDNAVGTKVAALEWLTEVAEMAPMQVAQELTYLVPLMSSVLHDMSSKVVDAASVAAQACCSTVDNRDVSPFVTDLVDAMRDPDLIPDTISKLASLTFVSTVETPALALVVPLLHRGLALRGAAINRMCAVITANMSRLVEQPHEAAPFLPQILPALQREAEHLSEPEARAKCGEAVEQLIRIQTAAEAARPPLSPEKMLELVKVEVGEAADRAMPQQVIYTAQLCSTLVAIKVFDAAAWASVVVPYLTGDVAACDEALTEEAANALSFKLCTQAQELAGPEEEEDEDEDLEDVCDTVFTLAYGTKILLHNTRLNLKKGTKYGLLGPNQSGKSTLLRSIANGSIEDFPDADELKCVFVEADIQGEMSHLVCLEYVFADPAIQSCGVSREEVSKTLLGVGFTEKMLGDGVMTLSGGWRMKLALARAMLQRADVLLMDEPTNHLDVLNVAWLMDYLISLKDVTCLICSHHAELLDKCCTHMMNIDNLKLTVEKGNMTSYAKRHPEARAFFELSMDKMKFNFPQPGPLEGVKSKGRALMKMTGVDFCYPGNTENTLNNVTVQLSLLSRVACVGVNGAGKSTLVKLLTGEMMPSKGEVWQHPSARIAYVAQHAFHHIEKHLDLTPVQYIMWRYANGEDKEAIKKDAFTLSDEEKAKLAEPIVVDVMVNGVEKKMKRVVKKIEDRRPMRHGKGYEYEVSFVDQPREAAQWLEGDRLWRLGFTKMIKAMDARCLAREGMYKRPLTTSNVEKHCGNVGLEAEVATHTRMGALSGGEKVKVVLAACTWNQPHIIVLDEPTNYLDRDALGALAGAIKVYEGGILMVTHNDSFCNALCPESWVVGGGVCEIRGDVSWMAEAMKEKIDFVAVDTMVDAAGNTTKVKGKKTLSRKEKRALEKRRKAAAARGEVLSDDDEFWATGGAGGPV